MTKSTSSFAGLQASTDYSRLGSLRNRRRRPSVKTEPVV